MSYVIAQYCWPGPCGELTPGRAVTTLSTAAVVIAYAAATYMLK